MDFFETVSRLWELGVSPTGRVPRREWAETLVEAAHALSGHEPIVLFEADPLAQEFVPVATRGLTPETLSRLRVRSGEGLLGPAAAATRRMFATRLEGAALPHEEFLRAPYGTWPILCQGRTAAFLLLGSLPTAPLPAETLRLLDFLAQQASRLLENHRFFEELQRSYDQTIAGLTQAMQAKDEVTFRHCDRTQGLVRAFAEEWAFPEPLIETVEQGALLHDIGKIGIPDAILKKPAALTPEEYTVIKTHPLMGYRILQPIPALHNAAGIVLHHQEWFNGAGYPDQLAGEEIPVGARLVTIIDAWDAMTSNRPYRAALPKNAALAELRRFAGTQFDPKGVEAFMRVLEKMEAQGVASTERQPAP